MQSFSIFDCTPAKAFIDAMDAARESERRDAERHSAARRPSPLSGKVAALFRRIAGAVAKRRAGAAAQPLKTPAEAAG